jgi:hypothetical protein
LLPRFEGYKETFKLILSPAEFIFNFWEDFLYSRKAALLKYLEFIIFQQ